MQTPQCPPYQPTPTRWPFFQVVTAEPTSSITPAISWPVTSGYFKPDHWPATASASLWQTPQAWTRMRTQFGFGDGISLSTICNGPPGAGMRMDFMTHYRIVVNQSRSASIGSMRVARRAGKNVARSAVAKTTAANEARVRGSVGCTWNNMVDIKRVSASDAMIPITMPAALSVAPCDKTSFQTLDRCAPKAMRIAISPARWTTAYEITP